MRSLPPGSSGQALLELALVLPLILLLGCGAVAVVQLARIQMALETTASATALVAARAADAEQACREAHQELDSVLSLAGGVLPEHLQDAGAGACSGDLPVVSELPSSLGRGSFSIWFGWGAPGDTFCRVGGGPAGGGVTDGDAVVDLAYRPDLAWIPLLGGWMSPTLRTSSAAKIDPFRSRDPVQDPSGDDC